MVKNPLETQENIWSLGQEDPEEKGIATYSNTLAWRIPWTEEPGGLGLSSMGCYSIGFPGNSFVRGYLLSSAFRIPTPMKRKGKMPYWKSRDQKARNPMTASVNTWKVQELEGGFRIHLNSTFTEGHAFITRFYWPLATDRSREKLGPSACNHLELKQLQCTVEGPQGSLDRYFLHLHHTSQGHQVALGPDRHIYYFIFLKRK